MGGVLGTSFGLLIVAALLFFIKSDKRSKIRTIVALLIVVAAVVILFGGALEWPQVLAFLAGFLDVLAIIATAVQAASTWLVDVLRDGAAQIRSMA